MKAMRVGAHLLLAAALACSGCTKPKPTGKVETSPDGRKMIVHLRDNVTIRLVLVPAGKFVMGSPATEKDHCDDEGPTRVVTITKPFYIALTETTQAQYEAVVNDNPSTFKGATNPVEEVSWQEAVAFCKELSRLTGRTFRLPTEAQWEYACRAGTQTAYCSGDREDDLKSVGWYAFDPAVVKSTRPVGTLRYSPWGLCDMHGNVWEWCSDWYAEQYYAAKDNLTDPQGPSTGAERVLRGGSWADEAADCRSAYRESQPPDYSDDDIGFRIVCDP